MLPSVDRLDKLLFRYSNKRVTQQTTILMHFHCGHRTCHNYMRNEGKVMHSIIYIAEREDTHKIQVAKHPLSGCQVPKIPLHTVKHLGLSPFMTLISTPGSIRKDVNDSNQRSFWVENSFQVIHAHCLSSTLEIYAESPTFDLLLRPAKGSTVRPYSFRCIIGRCPSK